MDSEEDNLPQEGQDRWTLAGHGYVLYLTLIILGMLVSFAAAPRTDGSAGDKVSAPSVMIFLLALLYSAHLAARFLSDRNWRRRDDYVREVRWSVVDVVAMAMLYLAVGAVYGTFVGDTARSSNGTGEISIEDIGVSLAAFCVMLAFGISVLRQRGAGFGKSMGMTMRPRGRLVVVGLVAFLAFQPFRIMYGTVIVWFFKAFGLPIEQHPVVDELKERIGVDLAAALVLSVGLSAPFFEEVFFRGFLYQALRRYLRTWPAITLTGGLFALVHPGAFQQVLIFPLGLLLAYLMEKTGSLIPCMTVHFLVNASSLILLLLTGG
ncbi:MAG: CPBP family intramembrane metalloprotease [bacterium]|nr:CPBP family intramembrane metalloprotease [bacterium]